MRFWFFVAVLCSLFLISCSNSEFYGEGGASPEWTWVPYGSNHLRISGRYNNQSDDYVILSWSGSSVTVAFVGSALEAKMRTDEVLYLNVFVDGAEDPSSVITLGRSDKPSMVPVVADLPYGLHVITLYKASEANAGDWFFYGIHVLGVAEKELLPDLPERKIEFVGNSITCGFDVMIPLAVMESDLSFENAYYSYAGQTAKMLQAEAHLICRSGLGVSVNVDGSDDILIPDVYDWTGIRVFPAVAWDHGKWHPDAVVVNLGTNDLASGVHDSSRFVNATVEFIQHIRSCHPSAKIVMLDGPMLTENFLVKSRQYLNVAKGVLEGRGVRDLYRFSLEPKGESPIGVYYHPVKDEASADAEILSAWMRSEFDWD